MAKRAEEIKYWTTSSANLLIFLVTQSIPITMATAEESNFSTN